jgi:hypothetical protein
MAINLLDLRTATDAAIESATVTVSVPSPDIPSTINPNEEFTYSVTASNTAAGAVRLVNVTYHVSVSPSPPSTVVALLKVPGSAVYSVRGSADPTAPRLPANSFVSEFFLTPLLDDTLDVGDTDTISPLKGKAERLGNFTISCDIHGDVDLDYLFPKGEVSRRGSAGGEVV